jgi:hypothetical protein
MKTVLKWIFGILGGLIILGAINTYFPELTNTTPVPDNTEMLTETPEQSTKDEQKPISKMGVADCLTNKNGIITPDTEHLYNLDKMTVFQSIPDGLLMRVPRIVNYDDPLHSQDESDTAFLKTSRDFADGALLNGHLAAYKGTFQYLAYKKIRTKFKVRMGRNYGTKFRISQRNRNVLFNNVAVLKDYDPQQRLQDVPV